MKLISINYSNNLEQISTMMQQLGNLYLNLNHNLKLTNSKAKTKKSIKQMNYGNRKNYNQITKNKSKIGSTTLKIKITYNYKSRQNLAYNINDSLQYSKTNIFNNRIENNFHKMQLSSLKIEVILIRVILILVNLLIILFKQLIILLKHHYFRLKSFQFYLSYG